MNKKIKPYYEGKVRDLYSVDEEKILIVATDRVSAFDIIFKETIPNKGIYLNLISSMWFQYIENRPSILFPNQTLKEALNFKTHFITNDYTKFPEPYCHMKELSNRSMLVLKTEPIKYEFVVRSYLLGSAWKEYTKSQSICGIPLPRGLTYGSPLDEPILTPAIKEELGKHDINIPFEEITNKIGKDLAEKLKDISINIFKEASLILEQCGFILCDTKFEFGIKNEEVYLIDEILTPDSSRFWKKDSQNKDSYDKQILRDYLEKIKWNKKPPPPDLPQSLIDETRKRYEEVYLKLESILGKKS